MKKNVGIFFTFLMNILGNVLNCGLIPEKPPETAILTLQGNNERNWQEILRYINKEEGAVEWIPSNETIENWSELVSIQYKSGFNEETSFSTLEKIVENSCSSILSLYPHGRLSWEIIEKDDLGITYEWALHLPYKGMPVQHEICRGMLTKSGFHRIGITRRFRLMNFEEKTKWRKLLTENTSVVTFQKARGVNGFSMAENLQEKLQDSVALGTYFNEWQKINHFAFETGYSSVCRVPRSYCGNYVDECLEVVTMPIVKLATIMEVLEMEKKNIQERTPEKVRFDIVEHSQSHIIYFYSHPKDHLILNSIVYTFLTDQGYYSINYKKSLKDQMQNDEIISWVEKIKTIRLETASSECQKVGL